MIPPANDSTPNPNMTDQELAQAKAHLKWMANYPSLLVSAVAKSGIGAIDELERRNVELRKKIFDLECSQVLMGLWRRQR